MVHLRRITALLVVAIAAQAGCGASNRPARKATGNRKTAQQPASAPGLRRPELGEAGNAETHLVRGLLKALPGVKAFSEQSEADARQILRDGDEILARIKRENRAALAEVNRQVRVKRCDAPNIILIVVDDVGYGDLGCYGQEQIVTPEIDRMAAEGIRFTEFYAGSSLGTPSRCTLMTGMHGGHARIRGRRVIPLKPADLTVAEVLWKAGYKTGLVGKWGLGGAGTTGTPNRQGFYHFLGYLAAEHAMHYWPEFLWLNEAKLPLSSNAEGRKTKYSDDLFTQEALAFIERYQSGPFFLSVDYTDVHVPLEVPSDEPYEDKDWPVWAKHYAAMITRVDGYVGRILNHLDALKLADRTIVFFTSDNGPSDEQGVDPNFFHSAGLLRGIKGELYEGGIRVPMIVRWPGHIGPGAVSDEVWTAADFLPTAAALANAMRRPRNIDGHSIAPAIVGGIAGDPTVRGVVGEHEFLYWELHDRGQVGRAVRMGNWKAVRQTWDAPIELYDLQEDPTEKDNEAADHPKVVRRVEKIMNDAHLDSPDWPVQAK